MNIQGKRIWLTGASSGIGEALAQQLALAGAHLILSARRAEELERVRALCVNTEQHVIALLDLSDANAVDAQAKAIMAQHGPIDILINNAGIGQRALMQETQLAVDRKIMEVNFFSALALTRFVLPQLLTRPQAMVVSIASVMGKISTPRRSSYAASKHALVALMDALRAELHGSTVHVLTVCPGYIQTPFSIAALRGDGSAQGQMDDGQRFGMDAQACARGIIKAMVAERAELIIGGKETWGVTVHRWCPPLFRWLITRVKVT